MDPVSLQHQVRENSEDLSRYLGDLQTWQEEIKQKEQSLAAGSKDAKKSLPPVRSQKKKGQQSKGGGSSAGTPSSPAAAEADKNQPEPIASKEPATFLNYDLKNATEAYNKEKEDEEREKKLAEANYMKENGNTYVKNKKWKEAIECYTQALGFDGTNPIFYANRALCFIKLEKLEEAVADCSKAIELDPSYVKAYLRRGSTYTSLSEPEAAIEDLSKATQMEPTNKEARKCLIEAKLLLKRLESADNSTIVAISKPVNQRSKVPLKRICVEEVGSSPKATPSEPPLRPKSLELSAKETPSRPSTPKSRTPITPLATTPVYLTEIPEAAKNSVQFVLSWNRIRAEDRYKYLSQIPGSQLPEVFGNSLESNVVSEVLLALKTAEEGDPVAEYLQGLSETKRFTALCLFMTNEDKSIVTELLQKSTAQNHITEQEAQSLRKKFCV